MPASLYPLYGLVQMILEPQLLVRTLGIEQLNIQLNAASECSGASFRVRQRHSYSSRHLLCAAGLVVMEILIPIYWFSDSLVESHHKQASHSAYHLLLAPDLLPIRGSSCSKSALQSAI